MRSAVLNRFTPAIVIGATLAAVVGFYFYLSENMTGADVARMKQGGCPDGYVTAPTTGYAYGPNGSTLVTMTSCVPAVSP